MDGPKDVLVLSAAAEEFATVFDALAKRGIGVRCIEGPFRFMAAFVAQPSDMVVLDLEGLRKEDLEILHVIREIRPEAGVIALAGRDQREMAAGALCGGADLYLLRPVTAAEMLEAFDRAGMRRRLARAQGGSAGPSHADALARLALGVAHEVNNPLATISGWLQMLADDRAADPQLAGVLRSMKEEADRIADVVRQLLVFSQQTPPRSERVDVGRMVRDLCRVYTEESGPGHLNLRLDLADALPSVAGDEAQLRQACDAILEQTAAVLNGSGQVEVSCRARDDGVEIIFQDNGPVLSAEALERIFDPFHPGRLRDPRGMGLAVSYGIIQSHGGRIRAHSSANAGTRFEIWLPSSASSERAR